MVLSFSSNFTGSNNRIFVEVNYALEIWIIYVRGGERNRED